jgi:hypothetical protein
LKKKFKSFSKKELDAFYCYFEIVNKIIYQIGKGISSKIKKENNLTKGKIVFYYDISDFLFQDNLTLDYYYVFVDHLFLFSVNINKYDLFNIDESIQKNIKSVLQIPLLK